MAGSPVGSPVSGTRAWRWMIDAPASAAAMDCSAISSGVMGSAGDMVGVCADPVIAQVMITFFAISCSLKLLYVSWAMWPDALSIRSEEHTYELQSLMRISYTRF